MTLKELSQLYYLTREIEADQRRLEELERLAGAPSSSNLSGMPRAPHGADSKIERMAAEIVDLQAIIAARQIQCIHERARLERWISEIDDSFTRQIYLLRFAESASWNEVADRMTTQYGKDITEYAVKQRCYRYLDEANGQAK